MAERWPALGVVCPCDDQRCEVVGSLTKRQPGHARGCICVRCTGRRNVKKGWDGQRRMHKALGGRGRPPRQEEWANAYSLEVKVESKVGTQVAPIFLRLIHNEWFLAALGQAERSIPVGMAANAAVYLEPSRAEGRWLVVRLS